MFILTLKFFKKTIITTIKLNTLIHPMDPEIITPERKKELEIIKKYADTLEGLEPIPLKKFLH